jgi:hypothetical protein
VCGGSSSSSSSSSYCLSNTCFLLPKVEYELSRNYFVVRVSCLLLYPTRMSWKRSGGNSK